MIRMNKYLLLLSFLFTTTFISAQKITKGKLYSVTTIEQFLDVVGPDRTIELAAEFFFLPKEMKEGLVLENMKNLKLVGFDEKNVRLVTPIPDVPVITFKNCDNVTLENLELGHAPEKATFCDGHVVSFINTKNVTVDKCFLFGSGFLGISATNVEKMLCTNTTIRGCSGRILTVSESVDIQFKDCVFTDNVGTNEMISFTNSKKVTMENCEISLNRMEYNETSDMMTGYALLKTDNCKKITAKNCSIVGNSTPFLFETKTGIALENCTIHSNFVSIKDYKTKN